MKFNTITLPFFFALILALAIPIHAAPVETRVNGIRQIITTKAKCEKFKNTPRLDLREAISHIAKRGLGAGTIAGIVIGLVVLFVGSGIFYMTCRC
jgi:hypothetical protein